MTTMTKNERLGLLASVSYSLSETLHNFHQAHNWKRQSVFKIAGGLTGAAAAIHFGMLPTWELIAPHMEPWIHANQDINEINAKIRMTEIGSMFAVGAVGYGATSRLANYAGFALWDTTKFTVKTAFTLPFKILKAAGRGLSQQIEKHADDLVPIARDKMQKAMNVINVALDEFKDDEIMVMALGKLDVLSPKEYAKMCENHAHIVKGRETKTLNESEELMYVFQELSFGKVVSMVTPYQEPKVANENLSNDVKSRPSWDDLKGDVGALAIELMTKDLDREYSIDEIHNQKSKYFDVALRITEDKLGIKIPEISKKTFVNETIEAKTAEIEGLLFQYHQQPAV